MYPEALLFYMKARFLYTHHYPPLFPPLLMTPGTLLAMLFPDTGGLDQPLEMEAYWVQHYLVQAVPLYLLVRRDYVALRHASYLNVFLGLWVLLILHFSLYEVRRLRTIC